MRLRKIWYSASVFFSVQYGSLFSEDIQVALHSLSPKDMVFITCQTTRKRGEMETTVDLCEKDRLSFYGGID